MYVAFLKAHTHRVGRWELLMFSLLFLLNFMFRQRIPIPFLQQLPSRVSFLSPVCLFLILTLPDFPVFLFLLTILICPQIILSSSSCVITIQNYFTGHTMDSSFHLVIPLTISSIPPWPNLPSTHPRLTRISYLLRQNFILRPSVWENREL